MIVGSWSAPRVLSALGALAFVACGTSQAVADSSAAVGSASPEFTRITLERKPCYGTCPVYRVAVGQDGTVVFEGLQHVDSVGRFTARIDAGRSAALARLFDEHDYFALDDRYAEGMPNCPQYATDAPTVITSIAIGQRTKRVEHDLGCFAVPPRLAELERRIDDLLGTARWIGR